MPRKKKGTGAMKGLEGGNGNPVRQVDVTNGCRYYQVDLRHSPEGQSVRKNFTTAHKAFSYASKTLANTKKGATVQKPGVHLEREALEILNPYNVSVSEAARFYARYHGAAGRDDCVGRLVENYIYAQERDAYNGDLKPASLVDTKHFLKRFSQEFGHRDAALVTPGELDDFLDRLKGDANRRSHRLYLSAFFNWAVAEGCIASNPIRKTRRIVKRVKAPQVYSALEATALMREANPDLVPYLALSLFCGARSTEILKLRWSDIDFERSQIKLRAGISVTGKARSLALPENLAQYLLPYRKAGRSWVVPHNQRSLQRWMKKLHARLSIKPVYQGTRHTFAMYHMALHPMVETMNELGCSSTESLFKYSLTSTDKLKAQAENYFNIVPEKQAEIIPLEKEAA